MRDKLIITLLSLCLLCGCVPFLRSSSESQSSTAQAVTWPNEFEGQELTLLPLTERERRFASGFPGAIARFGHEGGEVVIRRVNRPSRKVHPAADCLRGMGYRVSSLPIKRDAAGQLWGCLRAERDRAAFRVCERYFDDYSGSWSDASSWYWSAVFRRSTGPWWVYTVAEEY